MERENLHGDPKGKGTIGANRKAESTDAPIRGGLLRSSRPRRRFPPPWTVEEARRQRAAAPLRLPPGKSGVGVL
jgi:hypothetical protein